MFQHQAHYHVNFPPTMTPVIAHPPHPSLPPQKRLLVGLGGLTTPSGAEGLILAQYSGITPANAQDHMRYQRSNLDQVYTRYTALPAVLSLSPSQQVHFKIWLL